MSAVAISDLIPGSLVKTVPLVKMMERLRMERLRVDLWLSPNSGS